jgi:hypothetical protein
MRTFWVIVRNSSGSPMRVTLQAENPFKAIELAKILYGSSLISEGAGAL